MCLCTIAFQIPSYIEDYLNQGNQILTARLYIIYIWIESIKIAIWKVRRVCDNED